MKMKLLLAMAVIALRGCETDNSPKNKVGLIIDNSYYQIVTIDSCEYIETSVYSGKVVTHKGN